MARKSPKLIDFVRPGSLLDFDFLPFPKRGRSAPAPLSGLLCCCVPQHLVDENHSRISVAAAVKAALRKE
jgi:hypothetical protein